LLEKQVFTGNTLSIHKRYVGGIEYTGANLEGIYHAEGRLTPNGANFRYEYTLKDHLGNSRVSFAANGSAMQVLQENHYYPFGMEMRGSWITQSGTENAYQYTGKELNEDFSLNWSDYGARWYDASVGRWNGVDKMAEKYMSFSVYNYTLNNPLIYIDPDGNAVYYSWSGRYLGTDGKDDDLVYAADRVSTNKKGELVFHNAKSLGVSHDIFIAFVSLIYQEANQSTESYSMANIVVNLANSGTSRLNSLEEFVMYDNSIFQGASQNNLDNYVEKNRISENSKNEVDAVINALAGNMYLSPS
jgi:RHS repeat-associated protein